MSHNFNEIGFTLQEEDACWDALKAVGLKPGANEKKIRFEIVTTVVDLTEGPVPPGTVLYVGPMQSTLEGIEKALKAAAKLYDPSDEALKMHIDDQMPERTAGVTAYMLHPDGEWADLAHEETTTMMSFADAPTDESTVAADQRPYAFGRLLDVALAAVRHAKNRPVNRMITDTQKMGAPKNRAIRLAVWKLLELFERETGVRPTVQAKQASKVQDASTEEYAKVLYTGTFLPFAVACLSPANLVPPQSLNSAILAAYTEWNRGARG
jgi:hypothetical protein